MEYIYAKAKTHKFDSLENTKIQNLKFRPIISQIRTYICNGAKVLSDYLKPFCQNEYKINDTESFVSQIKEQTPLDEDKEFVSYDVEFLLINIPVQEVIDYIIQQIYAEKKLAKSSDYYSKLIQNPRFS